MHPIRIAATSAIFLLFLAAPSVAQTIAPTALNSLSTAPKVETAQVMDQHGRVIGRGARIQTDQDGKPAAIAFTALDGSTVVLGAAAVSYDGSVLVADNNQPQVAALNPLRTAIAN